MNVIPELQSTDPDELNEDEATGSTVVVEAAIVFPKIKMIDYH